MYSVFALLVHWCTIHRISFLTPHHSCMCMRISGTLAFLWHDTNSFLCLYRIWPSTRRFSACKCSHHPHWNLLWFAQRRFRNANDTNTFSLCVCVQAVSPSRQCNYAFPSHPTLLFSFRAQRASATHWLFFSGFWQGVCVLITLPARIFSDLTPSLLLIYGYIIR
jgi:hypothetical protein